jgi:putative beta-barrel porin BBP2
LAGTRSAPGQDQTYASTDGTQTPIQAPGNAPTPPPPITPSSGATPPTGGVSNMDTSTVPKFYTITASLREEYDDNIFTTKDNRVGSFVTEFSPSVLVNFPMQDSDFSARYTFGLDYYEHRPGGKNVQYTHEALVRYTHNFSDRFNLDVRDQFGYYDQPDLLNAVGTPFVDGSYFLNTASVLFNGQWTPLFGTSTSYSNIYLDYENSTVGDFQNSDENTVAQDFRFAFAPKFNFIFGGIYDNIDYFNFDRGYTNYTGDIGLDWQALPSLALGIRGGASYTVPGQGLADSVSPYAAFTLQWQLGARSSLDFSYTHNVMPTDVVNAVAQEADRFSLRFNYDITKRITVHIEGIETHSHYSSELLASNTTPAFSEDDFGLDLGGQYRITDNFAVEAGYLLSDVSSQEAPRDYVRNQVYIGVRGTY